MPETLRDFQVPAADLPDRQWDAVVVGGGPAGSVAALHLARRGRAVAVLERHAFPRDKACGDLLIADTLACLRRADLYDEVVGAARRADTSLVASPSKIEWTIPGEFLAVRRKVLDAIVARGAHDAGAVIAHGRVDTLRPTESGGVEAVVARGGPTVRARVGILATGADVSLAADLGMLTRPHPTAVALRQYVRSTVRTDQVVISFDREIAPGYGWIFPMQDGWYNIGCGAVTKGAATPAVDLSGMQAAFLRTFPLARRIVDGAQEIESVRGARLRAGLTGSRFLGPGSILAVGETVGTTYPFTGEGIGKAMESGELAAEAVDRAFASGGPPDLEPYALAMEGLRPRYVGYEAAERWLSWPLLNDVLSWRARRGRFVRESAAAMLAETADPRTVFSPRGLWRSLVH